MKYGHILYFIGGETEAKGRKGKGFAESTAVLSNICALLTIARHTLSTGHPRWQGMPLSEEVISMSTENMLKATPGLSVHVKHASSPTRSSMAMVVLQES